MSLRVMPTWNQIEKTMEEIPGFDLKEHSSKVHAQYRHVKTYCSDEKLGIWNSKKLSTEDRWVEVFKHMASAQVPYKNFALVIEFILCLPGTSAPVERVFSSVKNIWKTESANLHIDTLKAILLVKCNLTHTCVDFYQFLKKSPALLRQLAAQEKYALNAPCEASSTSIVTVGEDAGVDTSNMSIDTSLLSQT